MPAPSIVTLDELKEYLGDTGSSDDGFLQDVLDGVSQRVENYTGRLFHPDPPLATGGLDTAPAVSKTVKIRLPHSWWNCPTIPPRTVDIPDVREIDTVTFQGFTTVAWETMEHDPPFRRIVLFGIALSPPPPSALPSLTITGRFGYLPPPDDIKDAVKAMAARRARERDAGYADSIVLQDGATVNYFRQFQPSVQATLESYARKPRLV